MEGTTLVFSGSLRITARFTTTEGVADGLKVVDDVWEAQFPVEYVDEVALPSGPINVMVIISSRKMS
jgi:hypothetical protein